MPSELEATPSAITAEPGPPPSSDDSIRRQIRGSSLLLSGQVISIGVAFVTQILIVRYLSKEAYGAFAYALSFVTLVRIIATFGFPRSVTRFVPMYEERREYNRLFGTIFFALGAIIALGIALVALVTGVVKSGGLTWLVADERARSLLLILIFLAPLQALDDLLVSLFAFLTRPRAIFFRTYVLAPALKLLVVLLLVLSGSSVHFLAVGYVAAAALGIAIYTGVLVRSMRSAGLLRHLHVRSLSFPFREVLLFSVPLLTTDLLYVVMESSDVILLGHFKGTVDVASLRVVQPVARLNEVVFASFTLLFTPLAARFFSRGDKGSIEDLYWQTAAWIAVFSFPIFAFTFAMSHPLTSGLYGSRYESSATYLALLSVGYYVQAAFGFNGTTMMVFGRVRYVMAVNVCAMVVNLGLNLALIPRYGALGAAIGTSTTLVLHNLFKQFGLRAATGVSFFDKRYVRVYATVAAATIAMTALLPVLHGALPAAGAVVLASLVVIVPNRRALRIGHMFPELSRLPLGRWITGE
jgi:O-antigen/teichoic acid export membrane protein